MKMLQNVILLLILLVPFVEIYLLLEVGSIIGALPTLFLILLTALIGAALVRQQGFSMLQRVQANLSQGVMPAYEMIEGLLLLLGGLLLLTPGFFTDALGFICLIPKLRSKIAYYILDKRIFSVLQPRSPFSQEFTKERDVLEGEYKKEE